MISVEQARQLLFENPFTPEVGNSFLNVASGCFLAEDVRSKYDHPFFDNSAVDGYAIRFSDLHPHSNKLKLSGLIPAGETGKILETGKTSRIFTGAAVPEGADTVIMQEFVTTENGFIHMNDPGLKPGSNVRKKGEQILAGQIVLNKGTQITPPLIGFFASIGIGKIPVFRFPKVHIIVTGDEFVIPGNDLSPGKIFESNGIMLQTAFASIGIAAKAEVVKDSEQGIADAIKIASAKNDLLILTGGVSVGDYDFTRAALEANAYSVCFHKISQKPGKPLLFARKENQFAFGLPGNPRAGMMAFYLYILPWLHLSFGSQHQGLPKISLPMAEKYSKKGTRAEFLTCKTENGNVQLLQKQDSHMLSSFGDADAIAWIPESKSTVEKGEQVWVYILPK